LLSHNLILNTVKAKETIAAIETMKPVITLILIVLTFISCKKVQFSDSQSGGLVDAVRAPRRLVEKRVLPPPPLKFKDVVILGNSITFTPSNPFGEWKGNWGMAASAIDSDYVHRLAVRLKTLDPTCQVTARNIAEFEEGYVNYDFDANLKDLRDGKPDLLILRIGEDIDVASFNANVFKQRYQALINYFAANNGRLRVLAVGPVWNAYLAESIMRSFSPYASLAHINDDLTNTSQGLFQTPGIALHPSDKGMRMITDTIWSAIKRLQPIR